MKVRRLTHGWPLAVEIVAVAAGIATVLAYVLPRGPAQPTSLTPPATGGGVTTVSATPAPPTTTATAAGVALTQLHPSEGDAFLSHRAGADRLVLPCPTDKARNETRTVVYEIRGFQRFTATVQITGSAPIAGRTTLEVLADDQRAGRFDGQGDGTGMVAADLTVPDPYGTADPAYAQRLSLRLTCELTGPTVTLTDARLLRP